MGITKTLIRLGTCHFVGFVMRWLIFCFSNIYWTDVGLKLVSVAMGDGRYQRVLIRQDIEEPLAIAVNPKRGSVNFIIYSP